ncbi:MAG: hypothetical protein Q3998_02540 [Porphyromonas sp.]|nr:hypothetical protein [Porphyromonas sp.]
MKKLLSSFAFILLAVIIGGCTNFGDVDSNPPLTPGELMGQQIMAISKGKNIRYFHYADLPEEEQWAYRFTVKRNMIVYKPYNQESELIYVSLEKVKGLRIDLVNSSYPDDARSVWSIGLIFEKE